MTRNEVWRMVVNSRPRDWVRHRVGDWATESVFNGDVGLWFINDPFCGVRGDPNAVYPDVNAGWYELHLMYCCSLVAAITVAPVARGLAFLPLPTSGPRGIHRHIIKAAAVGIPGNEVIWDYLDQFGIEVVEPGRTAPRADLPRGGR